MTRLPHSGSGFQNYLDVASFQDPPEKQKGGYGEWAGVKLYIADATTVLLFPDSQQDDTVGLVTMLEKVMNRLSSTEPSAEPHTQGSLLIFQLSVHTFLQQSKIQLLAKESSHELISISNKRSSEC